ncbi:hypothetical protein Tco_1354273 [Tanacetum coccineum]
MMDIYDDRFKDVCEPESNDSSSPTSTIVEEFDSLVGEIIKQKVEVKKISDPQLLRRRKDESILMRVFIKKLLELFEPSFEDDKGIISIEVSRQISPKVNSEPSIESLPKDDFDNDDDLFEMDSNNDEWKRILYGEDFERMDSDSDKTKDFDKSSSSVFKSLSDEFEPGGSSYVEGNDLVCYEDFHVSDALFSTINEDKVFNENVVLDEEEDTFTFTTRSFLPFVTYPEVLPTSYSTGSEDKVFKPGIFDNVLTRKSSLTLDVFDPLHPPLMDFHVTKAFSGFTFSLLKLFSKKFFEPGIKNATVFRILEDSWFKIVEGQSNAHNFH